ncbi:hypothetical protein SAMN05444000_102112 [Shimia gijangensis]|uniref:DUF2125 domain-containing protein n=1 Tax=Shimia gijangensis TaxID=1470563 RepID=A0A1M6CPC4_9RHOB|nr:DUF2125 domain-containing protein [Shimia gijangensis]SHI62691.1 hypothetical protein SAMN05444000_102112 [Shimia gijangensis]
MKRLLIVILVAAFGWSAYWFVGATGAKSGFVAWFDARQSEGWQAEVSDISVNGFPNRFDTTFSDLALADPETGVAWQSPFFQLFALSYKPNHVIAVWPHEQTLAFPDQTLQIASSDMKASLVLGADTSLPLERANLAIEKLAVQSTIDWQLAADTLRLALHKQPEEKNIYRLALVAEGFAPPISYNLLSGQSLPQTLKTVQADLLVGFDASWDRHALEDARPQPTSVEITNAQIAWGNLDLQATGHVSVDNTGYPTGEITIRATNWREIISVARSSDQIPASVLDAIEQGLELLAGISGNPRTLDIPLNFKSGTIRIGPIPIAPAPRLVLR